MIKNYSYEQIKPYIEKKLISEQAHPENSDVRVFNYTQRTQFDKAWDEVTMQCRGLIMNIKTGEILARPFPKFFNYQEHLEKGLPIPNESPIITEKYDGSLGILYKLNGKAWIATRGSFTSDQAIWATNWWRENVEESNLFRDGLTNLFEILFPENRIVVNYDFSGLVHLATLDNNTGEQVDLTWGDPIEPVTKLLFPTDLSELEKLEEPNSEGFVIFFPKANLRLKIKFPEYVRLHKIITGVSNKSIWELLVNEESFDDLLERVPDEFFQFVRKTKEDLERQYYVIDNRVKTAMGQISFLADRKEKALYVLKNYKDISGAVFSCIDGKNYDKIIWQMIKPVYQRPRIQMRWGIDENKD